MNFKATYHTYKSTDSFSKLVTDYLDDVAELKNYYTHRPDVEGIKNAIDIKSKDAINRKLLVEELKNQYNGTKTSQKVFDNIDALLNENCFTVCTAHQPNIFTGHLYFVYKILHAIKLADELNEKIEGKHFVPVYYMGSEDADLDELGQVVVNSVHYKWNTNQKGAVGRMLIDEPFLKLIDDIERQLMSDTFGAEIVEVLRCSYSKGKLLSVATFEFVNFLFNKYGLVVLLPDNPAFKAIFKENIKKELLEKHSAKIVASAIKDFPKQYKIQTGGREINLFYLKDDIRQRIEHIDGNYKVVNTDIIFTEAEIIKEVDAFPERFSPNVILRPLYQEMILPNVAFIGGGGELAYWLELKSLFDSAHIAFPVLMLRNSFTIIKSKTSQSIASLGLSVEDLFHPIQFIQEKYVKTNSTNKLLLDDEKKSLRELYDNIQNTAVTVDITLQKHVASLYVNSLQKLEALEKKMLRAEKKRNEFALIKIEKIKNEIYPTGNLQERVENMLQYYAGVGISFFDVILEFSHGCKQKFVVIEVND